MSLFENIGSLVPIQDTVAMGDLVEQPGRRFTIPFNQRPWVWKKRNLTEFWADLNKTLDRFYESKGAYGELKQRKSPSGNPHYFGAFVCYQREEKLYEVVDGQQRLTTVCMLAAILRELASEVSKRSESDLKLRNDANGLVTSLTGWLMSDPSAGAKRLELDPQYDPLFQDYVVQPYSAADRSIAFKALEPTLSPVRANLWIKRGFDTLHEIVVADLGKYPDAGLVQRIRAIERTLGEAFLATQVVVSDEPFALSVFSTLNARGLALNAADQIKNELFERADPKEHQQIKDDWDAIVARVPHGGIEHFLRQRHLAFVDRDCPKNELYFNVRDRELDVAAPTAVTARWRKDAELLSVLTTTSAHPKIKGELRRYLQTLHEMLGITYSWSLLLSAGSRYFPADLDAFTKLARLTLAFCFRVRTVGRRDVADLERTLADAALSLTEGVAPKTIAKILRNANSDAEFEEAFSELSLRRARTQFYALYELESYRAKQSGLTIEPFPHSPWQNVEHILPQKLSKRSDRLGEWSAWRQSSNPTLPIEDHAEYVNRMGNLLILESEINTQVSNYDFPAKQTGAYPAYAAKAKGVTRKSFKDSKLGLARDLTDQSKYSSWTVKDIASRQQSLAREAVKAWTLSYR